jgi:serine/threonine protein kinase/predicted Zn-dependent protease
MSDQAIDFEGHHPDSDTLEQYLSDALQDPQASSVGAHIDCCAECQTTLEEMTNSFRVAAKLRDADFSRSNFVNNQSPVTHDKAADRFTLKEEIARGGMGIIYRAHDQELDREVAVKVLAREQSVARARFERESRLSARLQHPGIVPIHQSGTLSDGRTFIAMKLVAGNTLRALIDEQPDARQRLQLLDVFHQVCQAVAYAHSAGIVHRDLKPSNIMVGEFGEVQVMDWGIAKVWATDKSPTAQTDLDVLMSVDVTRYGSVVGTPAYIPPEQARAEPADCRADVFALGGILLEIMTGLPPFHGQTSTEALKKSAACDTSGIQQLLNLAEADSLLLALAKDCLAADPQSRPADASVVSDRLQAYFSSRDERLRAAEFDKVRSTERLAAEVKRRRQTLLFGVVVVVGLIAALGLSILYLNEKNTRQTERLQANRDARERRLDRESKVRVLIAKATSLQAQAASASKQNQYQLWQDAQLELNKTSGLTDRELDPGLQATLALVREQVDTQVASARERLERQRAEQRIVDAIRAAITRSQSPDTLMQFNPESAIAESLEDSFAKFGLTVGCDFQQSVTQIGDSEHVNEFLAGLNLWRRQTSDSDAEQWFGSLIDALDNNEFRRNLRAYAQAGDRAAVTAAADDDSALDSVLSVHTMINSLESIKNMSRLKTFLHAAHTRFPDDMEINWTLGCLYAQAYPQSSRLAIRYFLVCLGLQPDNPGVLINLSYHAARDGDSEGAREYAERLTHVAPNYPQPWVNLTKHYGQKGNLKKSLECADRAIAIAPNFATAHRNRAVALRMLERYDDALASVERSIELEPHNPVGYGYLAEIYEVSGKPDQALKAAQAAVDQSRSSLTSLLYLARFHVRQNNDELALPIYRKLTRRFPNASAAWKDYTTLLLRTKRYEEVVTRLSKPGKGLRLTSQLKQALAIARREQGNQATTLETAVESLSDDTPATGQSQDRSAQDNR